MINLKNKSAVILNPERSEWVSRSHVTSVEPVVNDGAKTQCYSAKRDLYGDFAYAQPLKMTILAFLLSLNLSTSYAGECLPGECERFTSCTCNDNGELIEGIDSDGVNYKIVFTYDGAGHQTSYVAYDFAESISNNTPDRKAEYTYDSAGHQTSIVFYDSAEAVSTNTPDRKNEYTYDSAGHRTSEVNYNSADAIEHNTPGNKNVYDSDGNIIHINSGNITEYHDANWNYHDCSTEDCSFLDTTIVCAYGYTEGCVAGEVTSADGSKFMMQNGQIVGGDEVDESYCYANGQVYWDNACVDEYPFAKKRWTPAEASKWLHDGNDNFVVITFKK